jgi:hypothetical protein
MLLAGDISGVLVGVAVVLGPFVTTDRVERGPIDTPGGEHPLALDEQHVLEVTAVFQEYCHRLDPG